MWLGVRVRARGGVALESRKAGAAVRANGRCAARVATVAAHVMRERWPLADVMHDAPELEARARGLREVVPARLAQRYVVPPLITHRL